MRMGGFPTLDFPQQLRFFFFFFLNSQAKLQSRSDSIVHFLQMAHKKSLFEHLQRNPPFLCVCWFVYLFLYFVVVIFFCWTQLLGPHHAERPNMALSVNRSPGATRQKTGENHPAKFSARWLPAGIIWGPERLFFPPSLFPFSCMVSRLEGSTLTLLLTQPLRDGCNSSLSMAPVIEPSERERERV